MKFSELSKYLQKLEDTSSRISITEILAELFKESDQNEIDKIIYLLLGALAPKYENIVFNIAEKMMIQAIASAYDTKSEKVKELYKKSGDLGITSYKFAKESKTNENLKLGVIEVFDELTKIATDEGEGSVERKIDRFAKLLVNLDPLSAKFVTRIPIGKLRLGFSDKTIIDALSWMETGNKSKSGIIEKAFFIRPDVGALAKLVKKSGADAIKNITPVLSVPMLPMLAQRLKSPTEMIKKMDEVAVEPKYDGLRIQIHFKRGDNGFVKVFTRNMNETSWMFPELAEIGKQLKADEIILDSEAMGVDENTLKLANFQQTMTRRRKHNITETLKNIGIKFYVFDVLFCNDRSCINDTYKDRREILKRIIGKGNILKLVDFKITKDPGVIEELMRKELASGLEGVIVKRADSKYVAGRTGWRWVKMKEEENSKAKLADTLDCVVMGYTRGKGKRSDFGIGQFLAGVKSGEKFVTITKVGTGLTDEQFRELKKRLSNLETKEKPKEYNVHKDLEPDFWVTPSLVVELAADEITKSPNHTAEYALRFPRLVRFRDDKDPDRVTTLSEVKKLFKLQKS
jgi:DNA ligase 1